uniref:Caspase 10-like protein n=1 Tax=Dugesia japonica TaxID=6161 RepID=A0A221C9L0_DUGJA|nr:caspase 10-like protein [Dugesia japonica]
MSSSVEESGDDISFSDTNPLFDKSISNDSQSTSSQSRFEGRMPPIRTNLDKAQLACFERFNELRNWKLFSNENPIWIFPPIYLNYNAKISLIKPNSEAKHDNLRLVPLEKYPINNGEINFKVTADIVKDFKLDFFEIHCTADNADETDEDAYNINTARLLITIYDNYEQVAKKYTSAIIRNKNFRDSVIGDISISEIKRGKNQKSYNTKYKIILKDRVPYFQDELEMKIDGLGKKLFPKTEGKFPFKELIVYVPRNIKCTLVNTRVLCKKFEHLNLFPADKLSHCITSQTISIEERKKKIEVTIDKLFEPSCPIQESSKRTKEMCFIINQITFDDKNLNSRDSHSKKEIIDIEEVFSKILNYDVHKIIDRKTQELKEKIMNKLDQFKDYHKHIVVFVFSHGDNNRFHTRDGSIKYDEFVNLFLPRNCPQTLDKPKLFYFACCQGGKINKIDKSNPDNITEKSFEKWENFFKIKHLPEYSNIFMGLSTVPDYYNFRVKHVNPFIQTLLDVIKENPTLELTEIQNITQRRMRIKWKDCLTIASVFHCLTEEVFFIRDET